MNTDIDESWQFVTDGYDESVFNSIRAILKKVNKVTDEQIVKIFAKTKNRIFLFPLFILFKPFRRFVKLKNKQIAEIERFENCNNIVVFFSRIYNRKNEKYTFLK